MQSATEGERDDEETIHRQGGADVANFHFENDLFHVAPVVFLVFDLDCVSCGCIQVNFYTQVLCRSQPTEWMIIDSVQWTHV